MPKKKTGTKPPDPQPKKASSAAPSVRERELIDYWLSEGRQVGCYAPITSNGIGGTRHYVSFAGSPPTETSVWVHPDYIDCRLVSVINPNNRKETTP